MATNGESSVQPSRSKRVVKTLGPDSVMGEGDTELVLNIVPDDLAKDAFELLHQEVKWQTMYHRGWPCDFGNVVETDGSHKVARYRVWSPFKAKSTRTAGKFAYTNTPMSAEESAQLSDISPSS